MAVNWEIQSGLVFIINSLKKLSSGIRQLMEDREIMSLYDETTIFRTEYHGHAIDLAEKAACSGMQMCVAIGGDGTFNEVVNGILKTGRTDIILVLIPNGSGNDFCRARHAVFTFERLKKSILGREFRSYDAAVIRYEGSQQERYFLNIADIGLGGYTATLFGEQRKWGLPGSLSYTISIVRSFLGFSKPEATIICDGNEIYHGKLMMTAICNSSTFAGGVVIHPGADPADGLLNLTVVGDVTLWAYLSNFFNLKAGKVLSHPGITYHTARSVRIAIRGEQNRMEADGEVFGRGNAVVEVLPAALRIIV